LLFKHFPSKEAMYAAMQEACWSEVAQEEMQRLALLSPSTSSLVMLVYKLMSKIIGGPPFSPNQLEKLMIRSMLEDGQFARGFLKRFDQGWLAKFEECIVEAEKAGDVAPNAVPGRIRGWFVHDLAVFVMIQLLQTPPVADYGATREELIDYGVRFVLNGIGMTGRAVAQHYNPQAFALLNSP
jgi:AcrR family transcriptional regulator